MLLLCIAGKTAAFTIPLLERIDTSKNEIQGKGPTLGTPVLLIGTHVCLYSKLHCCAELSHLKLALKLQA